MRDVAARAGVSSATVSFVINNTKPVHSSTRARVEAAMDELGFRRNEVARALASNRTRIIALAFPALRHRISSTAVPFFTSAAEASTQRGYTLVLWPGEGRNIVDLTGSGMIDGVILMEVELDDPRVAALQKTKTPFTLIGRTRDPEDHPYVDVDFDRIMLDMVSRLASLGHRDVAFIHGTVPQVDLGNYAPIVRETAAFENALKSFAITGGVHYFGGNAAEGREFIIELLARRPSITALIIWNDHAAAGIVTGVRRSGKRIPEDISVFLADSTIEVAEMADPPLAVMLSPGEDLGRMAVETLIDILEGGPQAERHHLAAPVFRDGLSLGPAPAR